MNKPVSKTNFQQFVKSLIGINLTHHVVERMLLRKFSECALIAIWEFGVKREIDSGKSLRVLNQGDVPFLRTILAKLNPRNAFESSLRIGVLEILKKFSSSKNYECTLVVRNNNLVVTVF